MQSGECFLGFYFSYNMWSILVHFSMKTEVLMCSLDSRLYWRPQNTIGLTIKSRALSTLKKHKPKCPSAKQHLFQSRCLWRERSLVFLQLPPCEFCITHQLRVTGRLGWSGTACDPKRSSVAIPQIHSAHSAYRSRDGDGCQGQLDARKWK